MSVSARRFRERGLALFLATLLAGATSCGRHESFRIAGQGSGNIQDPSDDPAEPSPLTPEERVELAIQGDDEKALLALLEGGFELEGPLPSGRTALLESVHWSRPELMKKLLARGANPLAKDRDGKNAFDLAAGKPALMAVLRPDLAAELEGKLFSAVRANRHTHVKDALASGANPNAESEEGETALTLSISLRYENVVRVLLQPNVSPGISIDVNKRNRKQESPLGIARKLKLARIEKMLIQKGSQEE